MPHTIDVFWSFRSPYSYLVSHKLVRLVREYELTVNVRPVYPIAVRIPGFFKTVNPFWPPYVFRDCARIAEYEGVPFKWPDPDPIVMDIKSGEVAEEQPYIHRLTRLGVAAARRDRGLAFIYEVSRVIFGGTVDWNRGDHIWRAADRAGLDLREMDAAIAENPDSYDAEIATNEAAQQVAGHWGVPLMVFEGEPFFGQDRLDLLLWRLEKAGLKKRA